MKTSYLENKYWNKQKESNTFLIIFIQTIENFNVVYSIQSYDKICVYYKILKIVEVQRTGGIQ
jgi:predicted nucleotide-binding protein